MTTPAVFDATTANFQTDVIDRSREIVVVVDFWAPWCQPCQMLGPMLEAAAKQHAGRVCLAKVNIDENQQIAAAFGVQSIPLVAALKDAQIIDQFAGVLPEEQLIEWFQNILPSPADGLVKEAQTLRQTDPRAALAKLREARELAPDDDSIKIHIAEVLLELNQLDECRAIIADLETRGYLEPPAEQIKSQLDLRAAAENAGPLAEARQAAEANPDDLQLQLKLADALAVAGKQEEALQLCLTIIEKDKQGAGVQAKDTMLKIFDMAGSGSELTSTYRRKLATLLY